MADCCAECATDMVPRSDAASRVSTHEGRGLCPPCYRQATYTGRLDDYPRRNWSRDELLSEWELLRGEGHTRLQAAERLGMSALTFDRALWRARAAGDPRAELGVAGGVYATTTQAAVERAREAVRDAAEPAAGEAVPTPPTRELEHAR